MARTLRTLDDWDRLEPVEGQRIELKDGRYRWRAPVSVGHQRMTGRLRDLLTVPLGPSGWDVLTAVALRVRPGLGYIPDVIVCEPGPPTLYCYELDNGTYVETAAIESGNPQQITLPLGVTVTLDVDELARLPHRR